MDGGGVKPDQFPVTYFEAELFLNALTTPEPATAYALSGGMTVSGSRRARLDAYVRAGFLTAHPGPRQPHYALTPAGREFAQYLHRLEMARED